MHVRRGRSRFIRGVFISGTVSILTSAACGPKQSTPPPQPPMTYAPQAAPYAPYAPSPQVAPPASPPAARGWACASDADLACAYSHCIGGACGGCASDAECKQHAACTWTLFGNACMPRLGSSAPPARPPVQPQPPIQPQPPQPQPQPPSLATDPYAAARKQCVDQINTYRAQTGVGPLVQRTDKESCADTDARGDSLTGKAHGGSGKCGWSSQNECPGWPGAEGEVVRGCTQMMYREGPGEPYSEHGHYINMTARHNKGVACGFHRAADGKLWVVQNFY